MNFAEALDYLYERLPVFQNIGDKAYKPGLAATEGFCARLGNPHLRYKTIHIGGTNGKGSTSHMVASVLQEAGYKTGLYTSPHLKSFTERIKVNGEHVDSEFVASFVSLHQDYIEEVSPSFFEVTVALAFAYFAHCEVDVAVIEVGMGGRLDSTNVVRPIASLITNISFDHMAQLGDTLPKIAAEKAGIIKEETPVVISEEPDDDVMAVFASHAHRKNAELHVGGREWVIEEDVPKNGRSVFKIYKLNSGRKSYFDSVLMDLSGSYQKRNIPGVLSLLSLLERPGSGVHLSRKHIIDGLGKAAAHTGLKGRWQKLRERPVVIADTAHNEAGLRYTLAQFGSIPAKIHRFVIGFVVDKDISALLRLFPTDGVYYFCQPGNQRALKATTLASEASKFSLNGNAYPDVNKALQAALSDAGDSDAIYVGGSTFVVADLENL